MLSRNQSERRGGEIVGLLDVGTNKIVCLIAELVPARRSRAGDFKRARILGVGHQRSRGLKAGVITDLAEAEAAIRATIAQAERKAQVTLEEVLVSVSCGRLQSLNFSASVDIDAGIVDERDIDRLMSGARSLWRSTKCSSSFISRRPELLRRVDDLARFLRRRRGSGPLLGIALRLALAAGQRF